jgi:hypothetical protein
MIGSAILPAASAEQVNLRLRENRLYVAVPSFNPLRGALLDRLKNGNTVPFDFHLALWVNSRSQLHRRAFDRFIVSYDLWEERFSVTGLGSPRPSASNLTPEGVPAWCLDHVSLRPVDLPDDSQVWIKLDVHAAGPKDSSDVLVDETGLNLKYLIDLLARPSRGEANRWSFETGPVRIGSISR